MHPPTIALVAILLATKPHPSTSLGRQTNLHLCAHDKTISVQIFAGVGEEDGSCRCQTGAVSATSQREDYTREPGVGSYKLHTLAKTWNEARKVCQEEGGHLAVINSKAEETVLKEMLQNGAQSIRDADTNAAFVGIHDLFQEGDWTTVLGESVYSGGYVEWSKTWYGGQPDNYKGQNCGALLKEGGLDDAYCHERLAYFCELPSSCG